jgi:hypothetical protein
MNFNKIDPEIERQIDRRLDEVEQRIDKATYDIFETTEADEAHPQIRLVPYDEGAIIDDVLAEAGATPIQCWRLRGIYLESLYLRRPEAAERTLERQGTASLINAALGISPHPPLVDREK